jgi:hypothetical protein
MLPNIRDDTITVLIQITRAITALLHALRHLHPAFQRLFAEVTIASYIRLPMRVLHQRLVELPSSHSGQVPPLQVEGL